MRGGSPPCQGAPPLGRPTKLLIIIRSTVAEQEDLLLLQEEEDILPPEEEDFLFLEEEDLLLSVIMTQFRRYSTEPMCSHAMGSHDYSWGPWVPMGSMGTHAFSMGFH